MKLLPTVCNNDEYFALHPREEPWLAAARALCERHDLPAGELSRRLDGGNVVYRAGASHFIKLFAPLFVAEHAGELAALELVTGKLPVATPELTASGELEGWPYMVLRAVPGLPAAECWSRLDPGGQLRVAREIGELARAIRGLPIDGLGALPRDWPAFLAERRASFLSDHRRRGAPEALVEGLLQLVERASLPSGPLVLLHADLADVNVLLAQGDGGWHVSGVIDFGDGFVGAADYELVTPGEFLFCGRPDLVRAFLVAYGYPEQALDEALAARLLALTVLHRFANVGRLARRVAERTGLPLQDVSLARLQDIAWRARP